MTTETEPVDWVLAESNGKSIWSFHTSKESAEERLPGLVKDRQKEAKKFIDNHHEYGYNEREPDYWIRRAVEQLTEKWEVMTFDEFVERQGQRILSKPLYEITAEEWEEMLCVLPPKNWGQRDGFESFFMSEFDTSSYTRQYARQDGRYFYKVVDYLKPSTWIKQEMVANAVKVEA